MSNDDTSPSTSPTSTSSARRASFSPAGQAWSGLFGRSPTKPTAGPPPAFPSPIASAAANVQSRRRMSISTLGLSGNSPPQTSPFTAGASRRESTSSGSTNTFDESVIEEGDNTSPTTPLARRMSFGAKALRDRAGGMNGEGFNWADSFHSRAQRAATISVPSVTAASSSSTVPQQRAASVNPAATTAPKAPPPQEMPKAAKVPDPFQERILKGDFYMD
ncbi:MAG: hypothetical protein M1816_001955 [Peltula sp. TS41687]|nr:MAG: hypothetical protein M1816_001955 [Peltula sp. TS41687]